MYAIYCPIKGYFAGYEFKNNKLVPTWKTIEYDFMLAIYLDAQQALDEANKHSAIAYHINQLPTK